jgi:hypothetical protein
VPRVPIFRCLALRTPGGRDARAVNEAGRQTGGEIGEGTVSYLPILSWGSGFLNSLYAAGTFTPE